MYLLPNPLPMKSMVQVDVSDAFLTTRYVWSGSLLFEKTAECFPRSPWSSSYNLFYDYNTVGDAFQPYGKEPSSFP